MVELTTQNLSEVTDKYRLSRILRDGTMENAVFDSMATVLEFLQAEYGRETPEPQPFEEMNIFAPILEHATLPSYTWAVHLGIIGLDAESLLAAIYAPFDSMGDSFLAWTNDQKADASLHVFAGMDNEPTWEDITELRQKLGNILIATSSRLADYTVVSDYENWDDHVSTYFIDGTSLVQEDGSVPYKSKKELKLEIESLPVLEPPQDTLLHGDSGGRDRVQVMKEYGPDGDLASDRVVEEDMGWTPPKESHLTTVEDWTKPLAESDRTDPGGFTAAEALSAADRGDGYRGLGITAEDLEGPTKTDTEAPERADFSDPFHVGDPDTIPEGACPECLAGAEERHLSSCQIGQAAAKYDQEHAAGHLTHPLLEGHDAETILNDEERSRAGEEVGEGVQRVLDKMSDVEPKFDTGESKVLLEVIPVDEKDPVNNEGMPTEAGTGAAWGTSENDKNKDDGPTEKGDFDQDEQPKGSFDVDAAVDKIMEEHRD